MEAPPPHSTTTPKAATAADSVDSSPRSRHTDSWEAEPPPPSSSSKLRLMCSYGGHIVPRPHDKSLCYIGGDTRIIAIDRSNTSLADLHNRLSKALIQNKPFVLKYQIPNEDLDSLISVSTDEDLENMVDEYDRLNSNGGSSRGGGGGRLRLFLFPKSGANYSGCSSIEQLVVGNGSTKSEDWFLDALNGKSTNFSTSERGFSESSSVNCLLGLDDDFVGKSAKDAGGNGNGNGNGNGSGIGVGTGIGVGAVNQDVHSVPDSPMLDTTSSFGSTSSSPSIMVNLPPIRVHVVEESPKVGIEEQFQQMNVNLPVVQKQEEVVGGFVAVPPPTTAVSGIPVVVGGEYAKRGFSDDERSDHGGYRVAQQIQPQQIIPQIQQRQPNAFDLASPDSVSSEGSVTNPLSRQRQAMYQEPIIQIQSRVMANQVDPKTGDQNNSSNVQMQPQIQEPGYVLSGQYEQNHPQLHQHQQFVHAGAQYIPAGAMQMPGYYHVYPSQQQHYSHQPVLDQQYPVYFMPARQTQAYNMPVQQPSHGELAPTAPSGRSHTPPPTAYNQGRAAPASKPEMAAGVYRNAAPQLVQVPSSQHQAQYVGVPQMHYPSQSMAPSSAANSTYTYEYADPGQSQIYYTQPMPPQLAAQYQTMTSTPTMVLSDASSQLASENVKQQVRTAQP